MTVADECVQDRQSKWKDGGEKPWPRCGPPLVSCSARRWQSPGSNHGVSGVRRSAEGFQELSACLLAAPAGIGAHLAVPHVGVLGAFITARLAGLGAGLQHGPGEG